MQTIFIKFLSHESRVTGFYELITRARVASLPGEVYQVPISALPLLDNKQIGYRRATDEEVRQQPGVLPDYCNVYDSLSDDRIDELEAIILDRSPSRWACTDDA